MSRPQEGDRNQEATVYMGNLDERCTDALVWELMLQAGPVVNVHLPKDRISMSHQGYGFCEFLTEDDADYACKIMNQIKLFGKPIRVNKASSDRKQVDIGANLFIGSLDLNVDEHQLYNTFSRFGTLVQTAKIARDPSTGESNGYGFVSFDSFEAADSAIESMNNQFLMNKAITVQYAFKKDGKGERHGTPAERLLAAQARKNSVMPGGMGGLPPPPPPIRFPPPSQPGAQYPPASMPGMPGMPGMPPAPPLGFASPASSAPPSTLPPSSTPYPGPPPGFASPFPAQGIPPPPPGFQGQPMSMPPPPMGFAAPTAVPAGTGQPPPIRMGYGAPPPPIGFGPPPGAPTGPAAMQQQGPGGLPPPPPGFR